MPRRPVNDCSIIAGSLPGSVVHRDDRCGGFGRRFEPYYRTRPELEREAAQIRSAPA